MVRAGMTPRTNTLYAFGESPARALDQINSTLASRRTINFDDKDQEADIIKKPRFNNPLMNRIKEHKFEDSEDSDKKGKPHNIGNMT